MFDAAPYQNFISRLTMAKQRGGLLFPSMSVFRVIVVTDQVMKRAIGQLGGRPPTDRLFVKRLLNTVINVCAEDRLIFSELQSHEGGAFLDLHVPKLIEKLAHKFVRARLGLLNNTATIATHAAASSKRNQSARIRIFSGL